MTGNTRQRIDVAFGVDANFAMHAAAVIASVVHYGRGSDFRFIVMHVGVDEAMRKRVESVAPGSTFVWVEVGDDDLPPFANRHHFTRATLFRMGLEKLAPADSKRVLYLDADIAVASDVRPLWGADLAGCPLGGVHDPNVDAAEFAQRWNLQGKPAYFNAGILVVDLERVRADKLFSKAIDFIAEHGRALPWNDQDALNWSCWGRWRQLAPVWNVQRSMAIRDAENPLSAEKELGDRKPAIIHYTGGEKPWIAGAYHPWSWVYWQGLRRTPFTGDVAAKYGVSRNERMKILARWLRRWPWFARA